MKGILFKPDMIKAIVEGRKMVTRRLIKPQPALTRVLIQNAAGNWRYMDKEGIDPDSPTWKPRYQVGEVVYIKEAYAHYGDALNKGVWTAQIKYKLDCEKRHIPFAHTVPPREKWWNTGKPLDYFQSPLFMPAWAARYFIKIKDVRAERLQEITPEDCIKEGATMSDYPPFALMDFSLLWDKINQECPWESDPWVWRFNFKRVER